MGRKYVRDKAGRFAPKGGGSKGKGGKMGKSAKNVKARAAYKNQAGKLRAAKKMAGGKMTTSREQKYWNRQLGGAKSGITRVTNRLTNKRAAKSGLKETFASQRVVGRKATFKAKTTKGRAAKSEWKAAKGADRKSRSTTDSAQKRVIKKQTGKTAYSQGFRETPAKTKAPRAGSKTKAEKIRGKIESKKAANKALRGSEFKGVKKRPATKKAAAAKKATAAKKAQETAKQRYKKAKTEAKTAERFSQVDRGTREARRGAAAKGKFTKLKRSMSKGATKGKGYGLSKKGQAAKKRFTELKRERGGATKGKGTAAQKRAGIGYRQTQSMLGKKTKGRVPKGRLPGGETLKQQMKSAPQKQSWRGKGSKAKRRAAEAAKNKGVDYINMTKRQYSRVHKDFKGSDPKNPRTLKYVEGKGTVLKPVKFVKKYNQTDAFAESKAKRGSAATKRDRILRTAERNIRKSAGIKSPSFDRRAKRMKMAEDIMTKSHGGSTAWKQFYSAYR